MNKPKGYLTAKDLKEIKEFIEKHDPDITVEWTFDSDLDNKTYAYNPEWVAEQFKKKEKK